MTWHPMAFGSFYKELSSKLYDVSPLHHTEKTWTNINFLLLKVFILFQFVIYFLQSSGSLIHLGRDPSCRVCFNHLFLPTFSEILKVLLFTCETVLCFYGTQFLHFHLTKFRCIFWMFFLVLINGLWLFSLFVSMML